MRPGPWFCPLDERLVAQAVGGLGTGLLVDPGSP